jgi:acyl phosphate:glycerol-3-phosphate acyltransferase
VIALKFLAVILIGYILGSIPNGVIVSKLSGKGDVRKWGSGKTGATNVLRAVGKKAAALVLILDMAKGALAVFLAGLVMQSDYLVVGNNTVWPIVHTARVVAAIAAIGGHNWPIFLGFKGGRGVSTFMGGLAALCPVAAVFSGEVFIIGAGLTRYASFASIAGIVGSSALMVPMTFYSGFPVEYLLYTVLSGALIIYMHRDNIQRLLSGTERKLGEKAEQASHNPKENK